MTEATFEPIILAFACQHYKDAQMRAEIEALLVEEACVV
jgi:hypothetical protein